MEKLVRYILGLNTKFSLEAIIVFGKIKIKKATNSVFTLFLAN